MLHPDTRSHADAGASTSGKTSTIDVIEDLIDACMENRQTNWTAIEYTRSAELERVLHGRVGQRNNHVSELQSALLVRGARLTARHGDWKSALHREWTKLAHSLDGDKPNALIEELRRGDRMLLDKIDSAIAKLERRDEPLARMLSRQREALARSRAELGGFA